MLYRYCRLKRPTVSLLPHYPFPFFCPTLPLGVGVLHILRMVDDVKEEKDSLSGTWTMKADDVK